MKTIETIIFRIIALPFFAILSLIGVIYLWLKYIFNYILYGGEAITYTHKTNRKTIQDCFSELQKLNEVNMKSYEN